ncbi:MAG: peptide chain release factor N(5)-glutamine methyltransferase [Bacillota bacterium]
MVVSEAKVWTVGGVLQWTQRYLADKGIDNPRLDAEVLLAHVIKTDRLHLYVDFHKPLQAAELELYRELIKQRARRIPVAYITGNKEFMGLSFLVTPAVLIPRPDTEILVETVMRYAKTQNEPLIIDVGTGSGAIIVSLLKLLPAAWGIALDISAQALAVAAENACRQEVLVRLEFMEGDLLQPVQGRQVDFIAANPPYIPAGDLAGLEPEVRKEPLLALSPGTDGLHCYRRLVRESLPVLRPQGRLICEVGIGQAGPVAQLMRETQGYGDIEIIRDYGGIERVVAGRRK